MGGGKVLKVARTMNKLPFGQLMQVYAKSNAATARRRFPHETAERGIALAEQEAYDYLRNCFFRLEGAMCCLWMENEICVSALRLEPWKDGLLLTGLETAPERRNKGCACALIRAVQAFLREQGVVKLYSHIDKKNAASIHIHEKCGFRGIADHAAYLDGSVDSRSVTYLFDG